jgi:hypothetical protein
MTHTAAITQDIPAPPDATEVFDWRHASHDVAARVFDGTVRQAVGLTISIGGLQRHNGTCRRWVTVEAQSSIGAPLDPEAVRQLAAALVAAADEIEARR